MTAALLLSYVALSTLAAPSPEIVVYDGYNPLGNVMPEGEFAGMEWGVAHNLDELKIEIRKGGDHKYRVLRRVTSSLAIEAKGNLYQPQAFNKTHPRVHAVHIDDKRRVFRLPNVSKAETRAKKATDKRLGASLKSDPELNGDKFFYRALSAGTLKKWSVATYVHVEVQYLAPSGWKTIRTFSIEPYGASGE